MRVCVTGLAGQLLLNTKIYVDLSASFIHFSIVFVIVESNVVQRREKKKNRDTENKSLCRFFIFYSFPVPAFDPKHIICISCCHRCWIEGDTKKGDEEEKARHQKEKNIKPSPKKRERERERERERAVVCVPLHAQVTIH